MVSDADLLAGTDLSAPARLGTTIHTDQAGIHCGMGLATARDKIDHLEELVERDELAPQGKTDFQDDSPARHNRGLRTLNAMTDEQTTPRRAATAALNLHDIDRIIARAQTAGDLHHIETEQTLIPTPAADFLVRWVSARQRAPETKKPVARGAGQDFNPFLAPEPALVIAPLPPHHICLLNKFPVLDRHLLLITRQFEDQTEALNRDDFSALAAVMADLGGLGFYNGGPEAGASQRHKHLQWIPESRQSGNFNALTRPLATPGAPMQHACRHPALAFRHVFVPLDGTHGGGTDTLADALHSAYSRACSLLGIDTRVAALPPYNMLVDRHWMLLVPRSQECFEGISVNALGFAASLFVRDQAQLARIRAVGPLAVLRAVAQPD